MYVLYIAHMCEAHMWMSVCVSICRHMEATVGHRDFLYDSLMQWLDQGLSVNKKLIIFGEAVLVNELTESAYIWPPLLYYRHA